MSPGINTLVIGVGYFGWHHARILSELNATGISTLPAIDKLIVTRTKLDRAKAVAESIRNSSSCSVKDVIGAEVGNAQQLVSVLKEYRPLLTSITARDKITGDSIHAEYTLHALKYGAVLCEKPFSHATGDGSSLQYFDDLYAFENAKLFGLELPLAVVTREIMKDQNLRGIIMHARRLEFYWEAWDRGENRIIDDLVLHPWSLIPRTLKPEIRWVDNQGTSAEVFIHLFKQGIGSRILCKMSLKIGPGVRGLMVDNLAIGIKSEAGLIHLIKLNQPLEDTVEAGKDAMNGAVLLTVDNPLQQHIISALRHQPIVDLAQAYESQLFLEALHGYKG